MNFPMLAYWKIPCKHIAWVAWAEILYGPAPNSGSLEVKFPENAFITSLHSSNHTHMNIKASCNVISHTNAQTHTLQLLGGVLLMFSSYNCPSKTASWVNNNLPLLDQLRTELQDSVNDQSIMTISEKRLPQNITMQWVGFTKWTLFWEQRCCKLVAIFIHELLEGTQHQRW